MGSARGPGMLLVSATGLAAAAVAVDAGFDLPAPLRAVLFAAWLVAVGVLGWGAVGRPGGRRQEAWAAGGAAVGTFALIVLCVPGGVRAGRLVPPWSAPPAAALTVTTGDPVIARGAGVTLACVVEQAASQAPVVLDVCDEAGAVTCPPLAEELPGVRSARLAGVVAPLRYRFVAGTATTAWHTVTPTDPVALTSATALETRPPAYAVGQYPARRFDRAEVAVCLAGGTVAASLVFDRPAVAVRAVWQPDGESPAQPAAVEVAADHRSATVTAGVPASGRIVLTIVGEHDFPTVVELPVAAAIDHPPTFLAVDGFDAGHWAVRVDEVLNLAVEVGDDVWAAAPRLELLIGPSAATAVAVPVPLAGGGGRFAGRLSVPLSEHWRGSQLVARLRLTDAHPQDANLPAEGWAEFTRLDTAAPLAEQLVLTQRDRVAALLTAGEPARAAEVVDRVDALEPLTAALRADRPSLAGLRELNTRLAIERLDRLRLAELATALRTAADRDPTPATAARFRDRLAAVVAASPRLTAARAVADEWEQSAAAAAADRLADEFNTVADRLQADRATRLRPLADRLGALTDRLTTAEPQWGAVGGTGGVADRLAQTSRSLRAGRPADALPGLDAAGRRLADRATAVATAAEARADPREAARQLARWAADLRPGESARWGGCVRTLLAVTRPHLPSADTPDKVARDLPSPAEFKKRATQTLRDWLARPPVAADQVEVLNAFADQLELLPPPVEGRASRLAAAAAHRAVSGSPHDRTAWAIELRWRVDSLARSLAGDADRATPLRLGLPLDCDDPEAIRSRLDGRTTDRQRLALLVRWWAGRSAVGPDHIRDALSLLDSVQVGPAAELLETARKAIRSGGRAGDVAAVLGRLRDALGPAGDEPLSATAGLDRPTAAERLIALDSGGRLADRATVESIRRFAEGVKAVASEAAARSAELHTTAVTAVRGVAQADLSRLLSRFRQSEALSRLAAAQLEQPGDLGDNLREAAMVLRQAGCVLSAGRTEWPGDLRAGKRLRDAEAAFAGSGDIRQRLQAAAAAVESAGR